MKKLITFAAMAMAVLTSGSIFAGSPQEFFGKNGHCKINIPKPICGVTPPPAHHRPPTYCPPSRPHHPPIQEICPPVQVYLPPVQQPYPPVADCHVKPLPYPVSRCKIKPCYLEPHHPVAPPIEVCETCHSQVCHCKHKVPVCRIRPCVHPDPVPVVIPAPPIDLPEFQSGQEVTIDGNQFGFEQGRIIVQMGGLNLEAQVTSWSSLEVRAVLPTLPLADSVPAVVSVVDANGQLADRVDVLIVPQSQPTAQQLARR